MLYLFALAVAANAPVVAPSATPAAIATARPDLRTRSAGGLVLPAVPAIEPGFRAPQRALPSGDIAGNDAAFVGLSLDAAIGMALSRNTDLSVSQSDRRVAGYRIAAANGAYDVLLQIQPSYQFSQSPSQSSFQAGPGGTQIVGTALGAGAGVSGTRVPAAAIRPPRVPRARATTSPRAVTIPSIKPHSASHTRSRSLAAAASTSRAARSNSRRSTPISPTIPRC